MQGFNFQTEPCCALTPNPKKVAFYFDNGDWDSDKQESNKDGKCVSILLKYQTWTIIIKQFGWF